MSQAIPSRSEVRRLDESSVDEIVSVLCDAFDRYPVMRYVLGSDDPHYDERHRRLTRFFVQARVHREEPMLGVAAVDDDPGSLSAVALISYPGRGESPSVLATMRSRVWRHLGMDALERYQAFSEATSRFDVDVPHVHLNMIGVRSSARGTGLGRRLMDAVHDLSVGDPGSRGVTLTTEDPRNLPFYEHLGYRVVGHARVAPELETWGFFRPDHASGDDRPGEEDRAVDEDGRGSGSPSGAGPADARM